MYRIDIEYTDFLGTDRKRECQFHLTNTELLELEAKTDHALRKTISRILDEHVDTDITEFMSMFIKASYGEISPDGSIFDKSEKVWNNFHQSLAYDKFFMSVISDEEKAMEFITKTIEPL